MDYNYLRYAWIDLETTGLEPGAILEVACIITDRKLRVLDQFSTPVSCSQDHLDKMHDFVRDMHQQNGLLDRLEGAPTTKEVEAVWADTLKRINEGDSRRTILVGNSVGSLDRPFIRACMPAVDAQMHHRMLDMTSVRIAMGLWTGQDFEYPKKTTHRAMDDILECKEELRHLMSNMMAWSAEMINAA